MMRLLSVMLLVVLSACETTRTNIDDSQKPARYQRTCLSVVPDRCD